MKVLLIDPPFKSFTGIFSLYFPLGLAYVAGALKKSGYECKILDMDAISEKEGTFDFTNEYESYQYYIKALNDPAHPSWQQLKKLVIEQAPDVIGITAITTKFGSVIQTAKFCKEVLPNVPIIIGGPHASAMPELTAKIPEVDYVMRGEGDESMPILLDAIRNKTDLSLVKGLTWKNNGQIIHNPDCEFVKDLDTIPFPDRSALLNPEHYSSEDMGVILSSRGCPFCCSYCFHMWNRRVRYRSVKSVIEEIMQVHKAYGTTQFSIKDDSFTVKRDHVIELCKEFKKLPFKITFNCTTRVDIIDKELLEIMKDAGLSQLSIGIESGSETILKATDKGINHLQILKAADLFNELGIFWTGYFMMGLPQETEDDILKTLSFLKKSKPYYGGLGIYNPFPRTKLFDQGVEMGLVDPNPPLDHFLKTNPKDLFFKDPQKRVVALSHEKFEELKNKMEKAFHQHNTSLKNLARRAFSRRQVYMYDPSLFKRDLSKGLAMIGLKKLSEIIARKK